MIPVIRNTQKSKKIHHAHNNAFRLAMTDVRVAKDLLHHHLPEKIKKMVELDTLELEDGSFVDPELRPLHTDVLYSLELADSPDYKRAYIYTHIEHQSDGDPTISFRMIKYCVRIIDRHLQNNNTNILPVIIPLVIYNGKQVFSDCLSVFDLFGEHKELARQYMLSGKEAILLSLPPLRTVQATFIAYGSSLYEVLLSRTGFTTEIFW